MNWIEIGDAIKSWAPPGSMMAAACSAIIATFALLATSRFNKAKFVLDLTDSFLENSTDDKVRDFWSRLNHNVSGKEPWRFDPKNIRNTKEERQIDALIYKFMSIRYLLKSRAIKARDVSSLYFACRQTFSNKEVREYLRWVQIDTFKDLGRKVCILTMLCGAMRRLQSTPLTINALHLKS